MITTFTFTNKLLLILLAWLIVPSKICPQNFEINPNNWSTSIKYIDTDLFYVRDSSTMESKVVDTVYYGEKIVSLVDPLVPAPFGWTKIIYPCTGFILSRQIMMEKQMDELYNSYNKVREPFWKINDNWTVGEANFTTSTPLIIFPDGKQNISSTEIENGTKELLVFFKLKKDFPVNLKWEDEYDRNLNYYCRSACLSVLPQKIDSVDRKFLIKVFYRKDTWDDYKLLAVKSETDEDKNPYTNPIKIQVGSYEHQLEKGKYYFRVEVFDAAGFVLLANMGLYYSELNGKYFETVEDDDCNFNQVKGAYPYNNTYSTENFIESENPFRINLLASSGYPNIPIEKTFKSLKVTYGGTIDISRKTWWLGLGFGYNHLMETQLKKSTQKQNVHFKTSSMFFYSKFSILNILQDIFSSDLSGNFDLYAGVGGCYWTTKFQITDRVQYSKYDPEMSGKGWGIFTTAGITYNIYHFIIGVQYQFLGSGKAVFSQDIDFVTNQNQPIKVHESYNLFTGSQQVQYLIGYRLEL